MKHHDLIVIGTGSGTFGIDSSMADWDIGLIDQRNTGGTRLNYGVVDGPVVADSGLPYETSDTIVQNALLDVSAAA